MHDERFGNRRKSNSDSYLAAHYKVNFRTFRFFFINNLAFLKFPGLKPESKSVEELRVKVVYSPKEMSEHKEDVSE